MLSIQFPTSAQLSNKLQSLSTSNYDFSRACFSANIAGPGINQISADSCAIPLGVFTGFVVPGAKTSLSVPQGVARRLDIFSYLRSNASDPCPNTKNGFQGLDLSKIVRIGQVQSFDTLLPEVSVNVDVYTPADGINVLTQYSLPAACAPKSLPPGSSNILAGRAKISGGNFMVIGAISGQQNEISLQNGQYKIRLSRRVQ